MCCVARELLSREEWCGRGHNIITRYFRSDNGVTKVGSSPAQPSLADLRPLQGIIGSDGARWLEHRRFALKHLKDFGFGKIGLEGVIQEEAEVIVKHLSSLGEGDCR